jgi:hypothetical protein
MAIDGGRSLGGNSGSGATGNDDREGKDANDEFHN